MLDERIHVSPLPDIVSAPDEKPPQLAKGTSERSKESVQSMLLAGAVAFARDPSRLDILRPVGSAIDEPPRATFRAPVSTPNPSAAAPSIVRKAVPAATPTHSAIPESGERALLAIFESTPHLGETIDAHNRRKECELGEVFAKFSVIEARAFHKRLSNPGTGDPIATCFSRMIAERRHRLLCFLADARRREAIHAARR
jgi:hypothetical protein